MALIGVASLVVGLLIGVFVHKLLRQRAKQPEMTPSVERQEINWQVTVEAAVEEPVAEEPPIAEPVAIIPEEAPAVEEPVAEEPPIAEPVAIIPEEAPAVEEQVAQEPPMIEPVARIPQEPVTAETGKGPLADLLQEIESNINIANEPWEGKLNSFQTTVWESVQENMDNVPLSIYGELKQIYIDIRLANSIVRLSTEFNRRSGSLDDNYRKLCASINDKLCRMKSLVEEQIK
jgi:hypothetical protein